MKKIVAMLLACMMVFSLVACGGNNNAGADGNKQTEKPSNQPADKTDPPAPKNVTLNVTTTFAGNDSNVKNYGDAVKAWEAATGNKVNDSSATSDETFKTRVLTDFEVGTEPDVLFYFNGVDSNSIVEAGKVVSIEDIRAEYPDYASNMKDAMLGASPVDGKNYSVPVNGYWEGLFVNKTVLEAAGVPVPDANTTWDQFLDICQQIKDKGYTPIAASLAEIPHYWFEYAIFNQLDITSHSVLPKSADDKNGQAWVNGLTDIKTLYDKGFYPDNTLTAKDDETVQMFIDGKAAFLIDGSWKVGGIESLTDKVENFTVTYIPGKGDRKTTDIVSGLSSGYYITKKAWDDPDKRAAAVDFITYMTSDEMVSKFAQYSANALKNGVKVDESALSNLAKDGIAFAKGATGMTSAVQDQIPPECRVPVFDGMPNLVTGKVQIKDAVQEVLDLLAEKQ